MTHKWNRINTVFGDRLFLLNIILWWFIPLVCLSSLFCFIAVGWCVSACLTVYSLEDIWVVSSLSVTGEGFCTTRVSFPLGLMPKSAIAGLYTKCKLRFIRNHQTLFRAVPFYVPTSHAVSLHPCQHLMLSLSFYLAVGRWVVMCSCGFTFLWQLVMLGLFSCASLPRVYPLLWNN